MGKGSDPPPAPDYSGIAQQQNKLNQQAVTRQIWANRPEQITPWGTINWDAWEDTDPATGQKVTRWRQTQDVDPALQGSLETQFGMGGERTDLASDILSGQLRDSMGQPMDYSQFRDVTEVTPSDQLRRQAEESAYLRSTSRLDPQWSQAENDLTIQLRNKGLRPGDEAYDREMANFNRARNDAYATARWDATAAGRAEAAQSFGQQQTQQAQSAALRQQEITEELQRRGMPLEEINMLLAGQGVQPPSTPGVGYAGMASPANLMGAAQMQYGAAADRYNAEQAQRQGFMSGLGDLAGLGISAYSAGMFSDRRLKTNIRRIGTLHGYPFYSFEYVWGEPAFGVMSDEINQDAVYTVAGFDVVDYGRLRCRHQP